MTDFDCFETHFDKDRKECIECSEYESCKQEKIHYDRVQEIDRRKAIITTLIVLTRVGILAQAKYHLLEIEDQIRWENPLLDHYIVLNPVRLVPKEDL